MKPILFEDLKFEKEWQYVNNNHTATYESRVIPGEIFYSSIKGNTNLSDIKVLVQILDKIYSENDFENTSYIRIIDLSGLEKNSLKSRQHYLKEAKRINKKYNCHPIKTYICITNHWLRATLKFAEKFLNQKFILLPTVKEVFQHINKANEKEVLESRKSEIINNKTDISFNDLVFKNEWQYVNNNHTATCRNGVIPGKISYTSITGNIDISDIKKILKILDKIYSENDFKSTSFIKIIDTRGLKKGSFKSRQHYLKEVKRINKKYNCYPIKTYICITDHWLRATLKFAEKFLNQKFILLPTVKEVFQHINKANEKEVLESRKSEIINNKTDISFNNIKFKKQWQYQNSENGNYFDCGIIKGKVLYVSLGGKIDITDAKEIEKILKLVFSKGGFENTSHFRVVDLDSQIKISFFARQYLIKAFNRLYEQYNCKPKTTFVNNPAYWIKPTLIFAIKSLNLKFVFVSNVQESFEKINELGIQLNNSESNEADTNQTITISRKEINDILQLTGSAVWDAEYKENTEPNYLDNSPLQELYQAIKIMIADKEEILNSEKEILEEKHKGLLQQKLIADVSSEFTQIGKFEDKMNKAISLIGKFIQVSRVYIFKDINNGEFAKNTYEWCNAKVKPQIDNFQTLPYKIIPSWKKLLSKEGMIYSQNINELPQDIIDALEPRKIKSILILPIYINNVFFGFIGFDECETNRKWKNGEIELLKTITNIFSTVIERRKAEIILKESEKQHRAIIESTSEGCWEIDKNNITTDVNSSLCKMLGYSKEEILGKSPLEFVDEDNAKIFIEQAKHNPNQINRKYEITLKTKQNKDIFVIVNSTTLYNKNAEVIKSFAFVSDITEQIKTKLELGESKENLNFVLNSTLDVIFILNKTGEMIFFNDQMTYLFGYTREETINTLFAKYVPKKELPKYFAKLKEVFITKEVKLFESFVIHKQGHTIPVEIGGKIVKYEGESVALGTIKDITERKKNEQALKDSEEKFKAISSSANDGIALMDNVGNVSYWNKAAEKIFGYTEDEIIGKNLHELLTPQKYRDAQNKGFSHFRNTGKGDALGKTVELDAIRKNGEIFPVELSLSPLKINGLWNAVGMVKDITERKRAEQLLKESKEQYLSLLENLNEIIFEIDLNSKVLFVNPIAEKIIEKPYSEIVATPFYEFYDKRSQLKIYSVYKKILEKYKTDKTVKDQVVKLELKLTNGKIVFIRTTPIISENGEIIGHRGIGIEITEQKKAEQALLESEEKFRILFEKSDDAILVIDNGKFVDCNQAVVDMFACDTKEDLLNKHPSQLSPKQQLDGELSFQKAERMMKTALLEGSNHFEWTHLRATGEEFPAEIWLTAIPYKGKELIHATLRDITERKKRERELEEYQNNLEKLVDMRTDELLEYQGKLEDMVEERTVQFQQSEERHRSLLENSIDVIMRFDKRYRFMFVSPSIKSLTGMSYEKFIGKTLAELGFSSALKKMWQTAIEEVFKLKVKKRLEFQMPNRKWVDWSLAPEFNSEGEIETVLTSARDITARKKNEKLLQAKTEELEKFNKTMLNREMRMIELKEEVNELSEKLGKNPPYPTIWKEDK